MAEVSVTTAFQPLDFGATGAKEILQNVRTILATDAWSVPMTREFAWDPVVDDPINIAQAKIAARLIAAVKAYEPRAEITEVTFSGDQFGQLKPIVKVKINDSAL